MDPLPNGNQTMYDPHAEGCLAGKQENREADANQAAIFTVCASGQMVEYARFCGSAVANVAFGSASKYSWSRARAIAKRLRRAGYQVTVTRA